jgi:hypothetical protein
VYSRGSRSGRFSASSVAIPARRRLFSALKPTWQRGSSAHSRAVFDSPNARNLGADSLRRQWPSLVGLAMASSVGHPYPSLLRRVLRGTTHLGSLDHSATDFVSPKASRVEPDRLVNGTFLRLVYPAPAFALADKAILARGFRVRREWQASRTGAPFGGSDSRPRSDFRAHGQLRVYLAIMGGASWRARTRAFNC